MPRGKVEHIKGKQARVRGENGRRFFVEHGDFPKESSLQVGDTITFDIFNAVSDRAINIAIEAKANPVIPAGHARPRSFTPAAPRHQSGNRTRRRAEVRLKSDESNRVAPERANIDEQSKKLEESRTLLKSAMDCKRKGEFDQARNFFNRALDIVPASDTFSAFASMERDLALSEGNLPRAQKVYERAIKHFPIPHFFEPYGMLFAGADDAKALEIFERGLLRTASSGILHFRAAECIYRLRQANRFEDAERHLNQAERLGGLPKQGHVLRQLIRVFRAPHSRPKRLVELFQKLGFDIVESRQHKQPAYALDLVVEPKKDDLRDAYEVAGRLLFRCLLSGAPSVADVNTLIKDWPQLARDHALGHDAMFLVVGSEEPIRNYLFMLIEQPGDHPTIVPWSDSFVQECVAAPKPFDRLRALLDEWLFRRDLYNESVPVSGRKFFGREQELAELSRSVDAGTPVGLFGLRKVGKTSLLIQLQQIRLSDLLAYVDVQRIPDGVVDMNYLYWAISNELWEELNKKYPELSSTLNFSLMGKFATFEQIRRKGVALQFDSDLRILSQTFRAMADSPRIVLMIDEVERLLPAANSDGFRGYDRFFAYLRGVSQHDNSIVSIITGANPAVSDTPQWEGRDNPVFKLYREMFIPPLERAECFEMVKRLGTGMGVSYTENALEWVYTQTGGHPFVARQLCSRIAKTFKERPLKVDVPKVQTGIDEFLFHDSNTFREIVERLERDFPEEKELLLYIAVGEDKQADLIKATGESAEALRHLVNYHLVERTKNKFTVKLGMLSRWINEYWLARK